MKPLDYPLTNLQLELLKLFSQDISEEDLLEVRRFLARMFAEKAMDAADEVWEKEGWDDAYAEKLSRQHLRTPYEKGGS
jgi:hypothetical protein